MADHQGVSTAWAKAILCIFMVVALVIIVVLIIATVKNKAARDMNAATASGVALGNAYLIVGPKNLAVGYVPEKGTIDVIDTSKTNLFSAYQVAQLFSTDPTKTIVGNASKVRVYFPQVGAWYVAKAPYIASKFEDATEVTVSTADGADNQRLQGDLVGSATLVRLYDSTADASDKTFQLLSQGGKVQLVPAGVFGAQSAFSS